MKSFFQHLSVGLLAILTILSVKVAWVKAQTAIVLQAQNPSGVTTSVTTDASGNLNIKIGSGNTTVSTISLADGTGAAPSLFFTSDASNAKSGLYKPTTSYLGFAAGGTAIAAINNDGGGTQGIRLRSDDQIGFSSTTSLTSSNDTQWTRGGVGLNRFGNATQGVEFNASSVTLGTCGTGTVTTGARASAGEVTATGATTCSVNFTTSFTNTPFCTMDDETTVGGKISAVAAGSITFASLTSGDKVSWNCMGWF